jgi:hypothetical protein
MEEYKREAESLAPFAGDLAEQLSRGVITKPSSRGRPGGWSDSVGTTKGGRFILRGPTIKQYISKLTPQVNFPTASFLSMIPSRDVFQFGWIRKRPGREYGRFMMTNPKANKFDIASVVLGKVDQRWDVRPRDDRSFPMLSPEPGLYARAMLKVVKANWVWEYAAQIARAKMFPKLVQAVRNVRLLMSRR